MTQCEALWLQWYFPEFPIDQSYRKIQFVTMTQYKPFAYSDTWPIPKGVSVSKYFCIVEFVVSLQTG